MTVSTNIPPSKRSATYHQFNYLRAVGSLVTVPLTVALIGTMSSAGTATAGVVYDASDAVTTDALFGPSSELAIMCRIAYTCATLFQRGPLVKAVPIAEPGGGTANIRTITVSGTAATSDGNAIVRVAGRTFIVGIHLGDAPATIAAAVSNLLKSKAENLPVVVSVASAVVSLTHPHKGVNGRDVAVSVDQTVPGITFTVANPTPGTGAADHQPALDALSPLRYDGIAFANHASADITEINTDIAVRWSTASKTWGWYFLGEMGTIGTATALAAAANHQAVIVGNMEGCLNTAGEIATVTAMLVFSRSRPNAGYNRATVPLFPPGAQTLYTVPEVEAGISAGLTVFTGVKDSSGQLTTDRAKCERLVTTRTTTGGQPDDRNIDIAVSRTGVALAIQLDIASEQALGADANPDGVFQDDDTAKLLKDLASAILRAEAAARVINPKFVEADVAAIVVENDASTLGRDNVLIPYHANTPLGQVAWVHNITVGA